MNEERKLQRLEVLEALNDEMPAISTFQDTIQVGLESQHRIKTTDGRMPVHWHKAEVKSNEKFLNKWQAKVEDALFDRELQRFVDYQNWNFGYGMGDATKQKNGSLIPTVDTDEIYLSESGHEKEGLFNSCKCPEKQQLDKLVRESMIGVGNFGIFAGNSIAGLIPANTNFSYNALVTFSNATLNRGCVVWEGGMTKNNNGSDGGDVMGNYGSCHMRYGDGYGGESLGLAKKTFNTGQATFGRRYYGGNWINGNGGNIKFGFYGDTALISSQNSVIPSSSTGNKVEVTVPASSNLGELCTPDAHVRIGTAKQNQEGRFWTMSGSTGAEGHWRPGNNVCNSYGSYSNLCDPFYSGGSAGIKIGWGFDYVE